MIHYVIDKRSGIFIHQVKCWINSEGCRHPLIEGHKGLMFPEDHEIYRRGYKLVSVNETKDLFYQ